MQVSLVRFGKFYLLKNEKPSTDQFMDSLCFLTESIIDFLLVVARQQPGCCQTRHVAMLLGAYGATLSNIGRCLMLVP